MQINELRSKLEAERLNLKNFLSMDDADGVRSSTKAVEDLTAKLHAAELLKAESPKAEAVKATPRQDNGRNVVVDMGIVALVSNHERTSFKQAAEKVFGNGEHADLVTKAASPVATSTTAGYAAELVSQRISGAFIQLLQDGGSLFSGLTSGAMSVSLAGGSLQIPFRKATPVIVDKTNYRAEGEAIKAGSIAIGNKVVSESLLGAIAVVTNQAIARCDVQSLTSIITGAIREDLALTIDAQLLAAAAVPNAPAGLLVGLTATKVGVMPGTGADAAALRTALTVFIGDFLDRGMQLSDLRIAMKPSDVLKIRAAHHADLSPAFPEVEQGNLLGVKIVQSNTVPSGEFVVLHAPSFAYGVAGVSFDTSTDASIDMGDGTLKSVYQLDMTALRMRTSMGWAMVRDNAVALGQFAAK